MLRESKNNRTESTDGDMAEIEKLNMANIQESKGLQSLLNPSSQNTNKSEVKKSKIDHLFKLLLVGDSGVGKTSIMSQFCKHTFDSNCKSTIGLDFATRTITLNDKALKLQVWDSAGKDEFRAVVSSYYRGSHGVFIVFDITNRESFTNLSKWLLEAKNNTGKDCSIVIIGNKSDLHESERKVTAEEAHKYAFENGLEYIEISSTENVDKAFQLMITQILKWYKPWQVITKEKNKREMNYLWYGMALFLSAVIPLVVSAYFNK